MQLELFDSSLRKGLERISSSNRLHRYFTVDLDAARGRLSQSLNRLEHRGVLSTDVRRVVEGGIVEFVLSRLQGINRSRTSLEKLRPALRAEAMETALILSLHQDVSCEFLSDLLCLEVVHLGIADANYFSNSDDFGSATVRAMKIFRLTHRYVGFGKRHYAFREQDRYIYARINDAWMRVPERVTVNAHYWRELLSANGVEKLSDLCGKNIIPDAVARLTQPDFQSLNRYAGPKLPTLPRAEERVRTFYVSHPPPAIEFSDRCLLDAELQLAYGNALQRLSNTTTPLVTREWAGVFLLAGLCFWQPESVWTVRWARGSEPDFGELSPSGRFLRLSPVHDQRSELDSIPERLRFWLRLSQPVINGLIALSPPEGGELIFKHADDAEKRRRDRLAALLSQPASRFTVERFVLSTPRLLREITRDRRKAALICSSRLGESTGPLHYYRTTSDELQRHFDVFMSQVMPSNQNSAVLL